jgi:hypothetical protein
MSDGTSFCTDSDNPPFFKDEPIVVATFKSYQVYLTPSHRNIYTRIKLAVGQASEADPSDVKTRQEIDSLKEG